MCTSFKATSIDLCHSLAQVASRLCTSFVDPDSLSALHACRLIALDKCPGVRADQLGFAKPQGESFLKLFFRLPEPTCKMLLVLYNSVPARLWGLKRPCTP